MDRNFYYSDKEADWVRSLSARRAWIEIPAGVISCKTRPSLSARRAWIEMTTTLCCDTLQISRSPQGERG